MPTKSSLRIQTITFPQPAQYLSDAREDFMDRFQALPREAHTGTLMVHLLSEQFHRIYWQRMDRDWERGSGVEIPGNAILEQKEV